MSDATDNEFSNFESGAGRDELRQVGRPVDQSVGARPRNKSQPKHLSHVHQAPSGRQVRTIQPADANTDFQREHDRNPGQRPVVRLSHVQLDEAMFGALVRIDETLTYRGQVDDTQILDRISSIFSSQFSGIG